MEMSLTEMDVRALATLRVDGDELEGVQLQQMCEL